jgi:hypothetical protein
MPPELVLPTHAGRKDEARMQYQAASTLDLNEADRVELMSQMQAKVWEFEAAGNVCFGDIPLPLRGVFLIG